MYFVVKAYTLCIVAFKSSVLSYLFSIHFLCVYVCVYMCVCECV